MTSDVTPDHAALFFDVIDKTLNIHAKAIKNRILSQYSDLEWTTDHYQQLQPLIRAELDDFMQYFFGILDNVGSTRVPSGVLAYRLNVIPMQKDEHRHITALPEVDIREGTSDYADMWWNYLADKKDARSQNAAHRIDKR